MTDVKWQIVANYKPNLERSKPGIPPPGIIPL